MAVRWVGGIAAACGGLVGLFGSLVMEAPPIPLYADQTRALLWIQMVVTTIGVLLFIVGAINFQPVMPTDGDLYAWAALGVLFFGGLQARWVGKCLTRYLFPQLARVSAGQVSAVPFVSPPR